MTAWLSYLAGDVLGLSGILALFVCAVAISHYALHNISGEVGRGGGAAGAASGKGRLGRGAYRRRQSARGAARPAPSVGITRAPSLRRHRGRAAESRTTTIYAFHTLSYISEGVIFVYCGLDALDPLKWQARVCLPGMEAPAACWLGGWGRVLLQLGGCRLYCGAATALHCLAPR